MIVELTRIVTFEAAHRLPAVPDGHSYTVEITVRGAVDPITGFFIDYEDIQQAWAPLHKALDHRYLNEIEGLENPSTEVLAGWIWERLDVPGLHKLTIQETGKERCTYRGEV